MDAVREIRTLAGEKCFVSGMSAMVTDLKDLCEREEPVYVGIAVLLATVAMMIFMDSWIIPFVFLLSIGMAIVVNLGSNFLFGEISYITKALAAVLQLAVTMDYSIFLWHSYNEELEKGKDKKIAMARAIANTLTSVVGQLHYHHRRIHCALLHDLYAGAGSWPCHGKRCVVRCHRLRHNAALADFDS